MGAAETLINEIYELRSFKTNAHQLSNVLGLTDQESSSMLLDELMNQRLLNHAAADKWLAQLSQGNNNQINWQCTFVRHDIIRRYFTERGRERLKMAQLKQVAEDYVIDLNEPNHFEIDKVIELIRAKHLFTNKITESWVITVLLHGKTETMARFGQTPRQFATKLRNAEKYCQNHRQRFQGVICSKNDQLLIDEKRVLLEIVTALEAATYSDAGFQAVIVKYMDYVEDLMGNVPGIINQTKLINNWSDAPKPERYRLVNGIYERLFFVENKLKER